MAIGTSNTRPSASRAFLRYNLLRLGLLAVCLGVGWLAGLRSVLLLVVALAVSGVLSWFLLRRQREAMGEAVEQTVERSRVRLSTRTAEEDAYVDAMITGSSTSQPAAEPANPTGASSTS